MIPGCIVGFGILMVSFGIWGIIWWDEFGKLSSDIKDLIDKSDL